MRDAAELGLKNDDLGGRVNQPTTRDESVYAAGVSPTSDSALLRAVPEALLTPDRARDLLTNALVAAEIPVCVHDAEGRFLYINPAFARQWQISDRGVRGRTAYEVFGRSSHIERLVETVADALAAGEPREMSIRAGGMHLEIRTFPLGPPDSDVWAALTLVEDVTERLATAEAACHLAAVMSSVDLAIFSLSADGIICSWNAGAQALFGYRPEEAVGQEAAELLTPCSERETSRAFYRSVLAGGSLTVEAVRRRKDGSELLAELNLTPIRQPGGATSGVSVVVYDVTARRDAERQTAWLSAAFNTLADIMFVTDTDGVIVACNTASARAVGYTRDELVGRHMGDLIPPEDADANVRRFQALTTRGEPVREVPMRFRRRDGSILDANMSASAVRDRHGNLIGLAGISRDVSKQLAAERQWSAPR